jgi:hypothetical protein
VRRGSALVGARTVIALRPVAQRDIDELVAVALRAWQPVHASLAAVLGLRLNARVYPDWAASQASGVREACVDPEIEVTVAVVTSWPANVWLVRRGIKVPM